MLKKFFLVVCGSFVGVFLALIFFTISSILISFAIFGSMANSKGGKIEKNSIMYVKLEGMLNERSSGGNNSLMSLMSNQGATQSLSTLIKGLKIAKEDENIKGLYLDCRGMASGISSH